MEKKYVTINGEKFELMASPHLMDDTVMVAEPTSFLGSELRTIFVRDAEKFLELHDARVRKIEERLKEYLAAFSADFEGPVPQIEVWDEGTEEPDS